MKYNIELLKADILDELAKLQLLVDEFQKKSEILNQPSESVPYYDRGAIGYLLHNFYNGCENIFLSIARFFENDIGPQQWHKDLLKRMTLEVPGFRPKVIDKQLFTVLDEFRAFRHKFRHTYAFELDWEREKTVAGKLIQAREMVQNQIQSFLKKMDEI